MQSVTTAVDELDLPKGASASIGGVAPSQSSAFSQLLLAALVAVLIVYVIMVATFRSLLQPLLLLVSVPFAATGAILLQIASGIPIGVASLIGRAHARRHRRDERDRAHRPRQPVPTTRVCACARP